MYKISWEYLMGLHGLTRIAKVWAVFFLDGQHIVYWPNSLLKIQFIFGKADSSRDIHDNHLKFMAADL